MTHAGKVLQLGRRCSSHSHMLLSELLVGSFQITSSSNDFFFAFVQKLIICLDLHRRLYHVAGCEEEGLYCSDITVPHNTILLISTILIFLMEITVTGDGLTGKRGADVYIRVPLGTVVTERLSDNLQDFIVRRTWTHHFILYTL